MKSGNLNYLEPSGPLQACNGIALPLPLLGIVILYFLAVRFRWYAIVCSSSSDVAIKIWSSAYRIVFTNFLLFTKSSFAAFINSYSPNERKSPDTRFWTRIISCNISTHICNSLSALCSVVWGPKQTPTLSNPDAVAIYTGSRQCELSSPLSVSVCHFVLSIP